MLVKKPDIHCWLVHQRPLLGHITVASLGYHPMRKRRKERGERGRAGREKGREEERKGVGKGKIEKVI